MQSGKAGWPWWPWWLGSASALLIVLLLTVAPLLAMLAEAGAIQWQQVLQNTYTQRVIVFTLSQAALSTVLSIAIALPVALAMSHKSQFVGRTLLVTMFSLSLVIPTIVAVYGIVAAYGRSGWLGSLITPLLGKPHTFYGLPAILIAHVFFNMPMATRIFLNSLDNIPDENWRLAQQLGMRPGSIFKYIEWPAIKGLIPGLCVLIFTLCFTSFAIVMTLGGGPRATTIEVAIFQALRFDFDINLAVSLACVQLGICLALSVLFTFFKHDNNLGFQALTQVKLQARPGTAHFYRDQLWDSRWLRIAQWIIILMASIFVLLPLFALLISAINAKTLSVLTDSMTLHAALNTVIAAMCASTLSVALALSLLSGSRHLRIRLQRERSGQWLQLSGNIILVLPPLVLGTGLFLLLRPYADVFSIALLLVILINSLMALPFILRILEAPMMRAANQQDRLIQSLGIGGYSRLRLIDWPQLRRPLGMAFAIATTLSAGDLGAIALFGSERVTTLPLLLYQRMGSYRLDEAAVTAGLLLCLCLASFLFLQRAIGGSRHAHT